MRFGRRPDFQVESFEYVEVGPGLALLRLAGLWRDEAPSSARLFAGEEELAALPEPPSDGGDLWRAAFSASGDALAAAFVLEAEDGRVVELPPPSERGVAPMAPESPEPEPAPVAVEPAEYQAYEPEPEASFEPEPANFAGAEQALVAERERHERTEASLREQLRVMVNETSEFMGRLEGYELRRAELEKELSWERLLHKETRRLKDSAELERDEALGRLAPVESEVVRLRRELEGTARSQRQLVEARERIAELERRLERQDDLLAGARAVVESGGRELADLEERLLELRDAAGWSHIPSTNGHAPALVASPEQADAVERAIEEADRGTERLAQLERRVGELREDIASRALDEQREPDLRGGRRRFKR